MHKIPSTTDLSALIGKTVDQVCFGSHQVIINLSDGLYLSLESGVYLNAGSNYRATPAEALLTHASAFLSLLDGTLLGADVLDEDALTIEFSNGMGFTLVNSDPHYECFQILLPTGLLVV